MIHNKAKVLLAMFTVLLCTACIKQQGYQEAQGGAVATVYLKQDEFATSISKTLVQMPSYTMVITQIDGKAIHDTWGKRQVKLIPGPHDVEISCSITGRPMGSKHFKFNAQSGKTYTISFPAELRGYSWLATACDLLKLE